ncbi:hypothetical protein Amet_4385 [Alkaliphilus metalliredigens QYMF]|uniref:Uncharacterized protein n=1 Tax=Alkaliphilus metalliredigens (strain QYMF) TaxID=293826 RepID=A6TKA7_ALKMQ|nr:hypothetical protein [Alkaliphilus metalliredigens]ABR46625.1 hypothetical protein Amet_0397 [Alkaliphilus metalliredigens QYMF]ABR48098.1 hypothetical protein Amet_1935 [Alkaliphilus metalliredigens QYMF]ABR50459.1 hypothetical protein Amet_4385 [Alkaliphilus metalliredigens QYMF]
MLPSKEEFVEKVIELRTKQREQKQRDYMAYVKGATVRMASRKCNWKLRGSRSS